MINPSPEDRRKADQTVKEMLSSILGVLPKTEEPKAPKDVSDLLEPEEKQVRGLPVPVLHALGVSLGGKVTFTEVEDPHKTGILKKKKIHCYVVGIFLDGFAYYKFKEGMFDEYGRSS